MKAWHIENINDIKLVESTLQRKPGEVKLKVSKVALSSTDIASFMSENRDPIKVAGHSAIAHVSEADEDSGLRLGARVVISPFIENREHGVPTVKTMGVDCEGLLQDFVCVPYENVFPLPDGIADEEAVFTEFIAMGIKVIESLECDKGDYLVIVGASTIGLILGQLAAHYQMIPILIDLDSDKLELAEKWGIYYTLNPTYDNLERKVEEITGGRMSDAAVFAGEGVGLNAALRLVKNEGEVVIAGYSTHDKHQVDTDIILKKQLEITGIRNGSGQISTAINLLVNKIIHLDGIINRRVDFEDVKEVIDECVKYPYQYNKILVTID